MLTRTMSIAVGSVFTEDQVMVLEPEADHVVLPGEVTEMAK